MAKRLNDGALNVGRYRSIEAVQKTADIEGKQDKNPSHAANLSFWFDFWACSLSLFLNVLMLATP